jgi:hypothetical protein
VSRRGISRPTNEPGVIAANLRVINKNTLRASVDINIPRWHLIFRGCLWHEKNGKERISFPSREWIDLNGGTQYADLIQFTGPGTRERFKNAALVAVHTLAEQHTASPPQRRRRSIAPQPVPESGAPLPDDSVDDLFNEAGRDTPCKGDAS